MAEDGQLSEGLLVREGDGHGQQHVVAVLHTEGGQIVLQLVSLQEHLPPPPPPPPPTTNQNTVRDHMARPIWSSS